MKTMKVEHIFNPEYFPGDNPQGRSPKVYKVKQVTDSITPEINTCLSPDEMDVYCESDDWKVTIT